MTGPKEGKSDESFSGEDEESLRELVSYKHALEIFYKFFQLLCLWSSSLWDRVLKVTWLL